MPNVLADKSKARLMTLLGLFIDYLFKNAKNFTE